MLQDLISGALGFPTGTEGSLVQFDELKQREVVQPLWLPAPLWLEDGTCRFQNGGTFQFRPRPTRPPALPCRAPEACDAAGVDASTAVDEHQGGSNARDGWEDSEYFNEYGEMVIHLQMLADGTRNDAYRAAMAANRLEGMTVVDVGAGTGFLSVLAARAGAKKVYSIEASGMAERLEIITLQNDVEDIVEVKHGMAEEVVIEGPVDALVSEWMGCFLLYEGMLGSVITARNRWLKEGGLLFPCSARMYLAPIAWPFPRVANLANVCGVRLGSLIPWAMEEQTLKVQKAVDVRPDQLLAEAVCFWEMDLYTIKLEDLDKKFKAKFEINVDSGEFMGFVIWFDVTFPEPKDGSPTVVLSTDPRQPPTHWKQDAFLFEQPQKVKRGDCVEVCGKMKQHLHYKRHYELEFNVDVAGTYLYKHFLS